MAFRIVYSLRFQNALEAIINGDSLWIYSQGVVRMFLKDLRHYKTLLCNNPRMGARESMLKDVFSVDFRYIIISPYFKVIYTITSTHIVFVDIWDTRRDPKFLISHIK